MSVERALSTKGKETRGRILECALGMFRERGFDATTMRAIADEAGVSRATIQRLEAGGSAQLSSLVRILAALGRSDDLEQLVPRAPVRPLEELDAERKRRRRASPASRAGEGEAADEPEWRCGVDR